MPKLQSRKPNGKRTSDVNADVAALRAAGRLRRQIANVGWFEPGATVETAELVRKVAPEVLEIAHRVQRVAPPEPSWRPRLLAGDLARVAAQSTVGILTAEEAKREAERLRNDGKRVALTKVRAAIDRKRPTRLASVFAVFNVLARGAACEPGEQKRRAPRGELLELLTSALRNAERVAPRGRSRKV